MYEELLKENRGMLWRIANTYAGICRQKADVDLDDLVQAGFFGLVIAQKTYEASRGTWYAWACKYVRCAMRETLGLRGKKQIVTISFDMPVGGSDDPESENIIDLIADESAGGADDAIIHNELLQAVRGAVDDIRDPAAREAVKSVYLMDKTYKDAAADMGIAPAKLAALLRKGRDSLYNNRDLRGKLPELDEMTAFHMCKSVSAFMRDHTSAVEEAVIWRENNRRNYK